MQKNTEQDPNNLKLKISSSFNPQAPFDGIIRALVVRRAKILRKHN